MIVIVGNAKLYMRELKTPKAWADGMLMDLNRILVIGNVGSHHFYHIIVEVFLSP